LRKERSEAPGPLVCRIPPHRLGLGEQLGAGRGQDCPLRRFARRWRGAPAAPKDDERERARNAARTLRIAFERGVGGRPAGAPPRRGVKVRRPRGRTGPGELFFR